METPGIFPLLETQAEVQLATPPSKPTRKPERDFFRAGDALSDRTERLSTVPQTQCIGTHTPLRRRKPFRSCSIDSSCVDDSGSGSGSGAFPPVLPQVQRDDRFRLARPFVLLNVCFWYLPKALRHTFDPDATRGGAPQPGGGGVGDGHGNGVEPSLLWT